MAKVIIGIHGLGNKPPERLLEQWWRTSIREGLRRIGRDRVLFRFELVYWAGFLHQEPLDPAAVDPGDPRYIGEPYLPASAVSTRNPGSFRRKVLDLIETGLDKLLLNHDLSVRFNGVTDHIIRKYFSDLDAYYHTGCPGNDSKSCGAHRMILDHAVEMLNRHRGDDILLIGHSMGSIIAYDALMSTDNRASVDTLVTMGSPLGIPVVMGKIAAGLAPRPLPGDKLATPGAVKRRWENLADLQDRIAFNYDLSDDYRPNPAGITVTDTTVVNDYVVNGHENPHKIYGYLRTPEFAGIVDDFFTNGRTAPHHRLLDRLQRVLARKF
jgi:hypothetical protein